MKTVKCGSSGEVLRKKDSRDKELINRKSGFKL